MTPNEPKVVTIAPEKFVEVSISTTAGFFPSDQTVPGCAASLLLLTAGELVVNCKMKFLEKSSIHPLPIFEKSSSITIFNQMRLPA